MVYSCQKGGREVFFQFTVGCLPAKRVALSASKPYKAHRKLLILPRKGVQKYFLTVSSRRIYITYSLIRKRRRPGLRKMVGFKSKRCHDTETK